jgi:hypothetical protein
MPRPTPKWATKMPEFLGAIAYATSEDEIRKACEEIKASVVESYPHTPSSRRNPMTEIRKYIKSKYPSRDKKTKFYYFTESGVGKSPRWEHLAIKYLEAEWDRKADRSFEEAGKPEVVKPEVVKPEVVKSKIDILHEVGLTDDEIEQVKKALGESDVREWVRQAIMQRASAINNKKTVMDEDLSEVPSEILMNEKKYRTNPTATRELVNRAVRVVKRWNHDHPDQKWCVTNKLISELTGVTVKAIAKAVEGMDLESYNKSHDLAPVINRLLKASVGEPSQVMSITKVTGIEGSEANYHPFR